MPPGDVIVAVSHVGDFGREGPEGQQAQRKEGEQVNVLVQNERLLLVRPGGNRDTEENT